MTRAIAPERFWRSSSEPKCRRSFPIEAKEISHLDVELAKYACLKLLPSQPVGSEPTVTKMQFVRT